jgi:hypothetical protein
MLKHSIYNPPYYARVEYGQNVKVVCGYNDNLIVYVMPFLIARELGIIGDALDYNLGLLELSVVVAGAEFPPKISSVLSCAKCIFKRLEVRVNCRIGSFKDRLGLAFGISVGPRPDTVLARRDYNMPLAIPFRNPPFYVATAKKFSEKPLRIWIRLD